MLPWPRPGRLIRCFEPSSTEASKSLGGPSEFAAEAQRSVDGSDLQGSKICRKEERDDNYFDGRGGKKGKKGKKGSDGAEMSLGVDDCNGMGECRMEL